ncbi:hypothetical protein PENTCL1PPCAC_8284, partial [Pristionchus entomophagus]
MRMGGGGKDQRSGVSSSCLLLRLLLLLLLLVPRVLVLLRVVPLPLLHQLRVLLVVLLIVLHVLLVRGRRAARSVRAVTVVVPLRLLLGVAATVSSSSIVTVSSAIVVSASTACLLRDISLAPRALDALAAQLLAGHGDNGARRRLLALELDERVALRLEASNLLDLAEAAERLANVVFCCALGDVADVHRRVVVRGLVVHIIVVHLAARSVARLVRVCGLSRGPVRADGPSAQPLAIHLLDRTLRLISLGEGDESVALRLEGSRVADDLGLGYVSEAVECLLEHLVVDLGREVAHEHVEVSSGVHLLDRARLGRPVDLHLLIEEHPLVHCLQRLSGHRVLLKLDERVRIRVALEDDFALRNNSDLSEQSGDELLSHRGVEVSDVPGTGLGILSAGVEASRLGGLEVRARVVPVRVGFGAAPAGVGRAAGVSSVCE